MEALKEELKHVREQHFKAVTRKEKLAIKEQDKAIREKIANSLADVANTRNKFEIEEQNKQIEKLKLELVQANNLPETEEIETGTLFETKKEVTYPRKNKIAEINRSIKNCENKITSLQTNTQAELIRDQALKIAQWDIYNQNAQADWFDMDWMFGIQDGFDVVIGNPPYGALSSSVEKEYFKKTYETTKTIKNVQKGSLDTYSLFIELGHKNLKVKGNLIYIVPISITSSESMTATHKLLENTCSLIKISSYSVRPQPVFENAVVNTSILFFLKDNKKNKSILCTKMYRKSKDFNLSKLMNNLEFIDVTKTKLIGRYPKISNSIENKILNKLHSYENKIRDLILDDGKPIYYRFAGGRYFKIFTNYPTNSSAERPLYLDDKFCNVIGCILSSNLFFWWYQIYSDNLNLKSYEIEEFPFPLNRLTDEVIVQINSLYEEYLIDIEINSNVRQTKKYSNIDSFKEYKIGKSKYIIDKIDDLISPLYGLSRQEVEFIKNYEIEYRISDDE